MSIPHFIARGRTPFIFCLLLALCGPLAAGAGEKLPSITVGKVTYSNVTVTVVSATDVYFNHAGGMSNLKLKDLDPVAQKHFRFDAIKASEVETNQREANIQFRRVVGVKPPERPSPAAAAPGSAFQGPDLSDPSLMGPLRGRPAPEFVVEQWITPAPDRWRKFVLVYFWASWCTTCREQIPLLNALHAKYGDRIVIVGVSPDNGREVRAQTNPRINYYTAVDPRERLLKSVGSPTVPYCVLVDPNGIVRYEGSPLVLGNTEGLERMLAKYSE